MTDDELIQGCREGQAWARRELYARTSDRIHRLLLKLTRNPDDALELSQDVFIRIFERIGRFDGGSRLETWVYRVAVNEGLMFLRRRRRGGEILRENAAALKRREPAGGDQIRLEMDDALALLPEEERVLIILKYYDEMSYAEIGEIVGKPSGTVASGLNRARALLRQVLEAPDSESHSKKGTPSSI